ncbi:MAG: OmpA family protein [Acidobacteria bacterium]|nr:OmpA family protein [Acidobacteriota bacterium]
MKRALAVLFVALWTLPLALGQGMQTTANKDDWEEINFEFNSSVLSDGYPSLLRLAELLGKNPAFKIKLEGHTDSIGSVGYNDKLGMARANAVKSFLVKYGAQAAQIDAVSYGKKQPKVDNKSNEGRFINRRVYMTITDGQGKVVGVGGISDAIKALQEQGAEAAKAQAKCCSDILRRLDKLDEIVAMLKDLKGENAALRKELEGLKQNQTALTTKVESAAKTPSREESAQTAQAAAAAAVDRALEKMELAKPKRFSVLGANIGADADHKLSFTGAARYFAPFSDRFALQAQGEYLYFRDRQEGQFDFGLLNRYKNFQGGLFSSFKHVNLSEFKAGGNLGQAAMTLDYLFKQGRVGLFGTKGFLDNSVVNRQVISRNVMLESYLKIVDQVGGSTALGLHKDSYLEANLAYLKTRGGDSKPGGTIRFVQPINKYWAFTLEGGFNETLVGRDHSGRVVAGLQFGNFLRPKEFVGLSHPVPVNVPRVRYELLSRRVRTGNDPPVADAGPDQIGVRAGTISFDGSGSFDPDGDPITFQWAQIAGPAVSLAGMNAAKASFEAAEGQMYSFRLTVKDNQGAQGIARVSVTTTTAPPVQITRFVATPQVVTAGQTSVIAWQVLNADEVTITSIGRVDSKGGTSNVAPAETTVYRITAKNRTSEANETLTITVQRPEVRILSFHAAPANITAGESASLVWRTENADTVSIEGIGNVDRNGSTSVSPTETTTYTLRATNRYGSQTATASVQVTPGAAPRILRFGASPVEIMEGSQSTLSWQVENAETITLSTGTKVGLTGSEVVAPTTTTTYTLTATNRWGQVSVPATVSVIPKTRLSACLATPAVLAKPGDAATLTWLAENATENSVAGIAGPLPLGGPVTVRPLTATTYNVTVKGRNGQASCQIAVTIGTAPVVTVQPPTVSIAGGPTMETIYRQIRLFTTASDPAGDTLTYSWRSLNTMAAVLDPASPNPTVQLGELYGDYPFEVTVTNSKGASAKAVITVRLTVTRVY